jgi:hypothetical protein
MGEKHEQFSGVRVFSATLPGQRALLGEEVTMWLRRNPKVDIVDVTVSQSSDSGHHCLVITCFFRTRRARSKAQ